MSKLTDWLASEAKLLEAATPGPWLQNNLGGIFTKCEPQFGKQGECLGMAYSGVIATTHHSDVLTNGRFIANVRQSHAVALQMVRLLSEAMEELRIPYSVMGPGNKIPRFNDVIINEAIAAVEALCQEIAK